MSQSNGTDPTTVTFRIQCPGTGHETIDRPILQLKAMTQGGTDLTWRGVVKCPAPECGLKRLLSVAVIEDPTQD